MTSTHHWWQSGVVYQIYPRSFQDSDGDGIGDLPGITSRLDYVQRLGVDAIWLSPIYPSPMADFGYDVADYTGIAPIFGTMDDFDTLLAETHRRGLKLILDLVPNHSSDEHPWFVEARSSRENPRRDWYIWRDPAPDGGPPHNWLSNFGGPAWTLDEPTGQYYLHLFDPKQPDLNWRNPAVREAIYDAMRFWYRKGVDGFRVDVIWMLIKHVDLPDNPLDPDWTPERMESYRFKRLHDQNQPEVHDVIREMRAVTNEFPDRVLIGEIYMSVEDLVSYYGPELDEVHLPFNFNLVVLREWGAAMVRDIVDRYERALPEGAWPNWVLGNHDQPRIASRVGQSMARLSQLLLLTLRGTPTIYYGDELGMEDVPIPQDRVVDPQGLRMPGFSRDPQRSPMLWDGSVGAGFTSGEPWLPLDNDYAIRSVAAQEADPRSMLKLTRRLLDLRRTAPAIDRGSYAPVDTPDQHVYAYLRSQGKERFLVVLNFAAEPTTLDLSALGGKGSVSACTYMDRDGAVDLAALELRPQEGLLVKLEPL
jgi:alpha-glucosidase